MDVVQPRIALALLHDHFAGLKISHAAGIIEQGIDEVGAIA